MSWKKALPVFALLATVLAPATLQSQGHGQGHKSITLNGDWNLEFSAPWGVTVWTFDMEQDGETLEGKSDPGMGQLLLDGELKGQDIEFVVDLKDGPHALTISFVGSVDGDTVRGTAEFEDGSSGNWTFTRA